MAFIRSATGGIPRVLADVWKWTSYDSSPRFSKARSGLVEDIKSEQKDGATRVKVTLYLDSRSTHSRVKVLASK